METYVYITYNKHRAGSEENILNTIVTEHNFIHL